MQSISHKWVHQVFRQRGIPAPDLEDVRLGLQVASEAQVLELYQLGRKVESGADTSDEIPRMRHLVQQLRLKAQDLPSTPRTTAADAPAATPTAPGPNAFTTAPQQIEFPGLQASSSGDAFAPPQSAEPVKRRTKTQAPSPSVAVSAPVAAAATTARAPYTEEKLARPKHHIYGAKAALTIELDRLREVDESGQERWSLLVEAATARAPRQYGWDNKIAFQITRRELPLVTACLMGYLDAVEFKNHGSSSDKGLSVQNQGDKLFVKVSQATRTIAVPVTSSDVHAWLELAMLALRKNAPDLGDVVQLAMLKRVADMERKAAP